MDEGIDPYLRETDLLVLKNLLRDIQLELQAGTTDQAHDEDLFPEWEEWLKIEEEGGVKLVDVGGEQEDEEVEPLEEPADVDTPEEDEADGEAEEE